jgi:hypothetical protein
VVVVVCDRKSVSFSAVGAAVGASRERNEKTTKPAFFWAFSTRSIHLYARGMVSFLDSFRQFSVTEKAFARKKNKGNPRDSELPSELAF